VLALCREDCWLCVLARVFQTLELKLEGGTTEPRDASARRSNPLGQPAAVDSEPEFKQKLSFWPLTKRSDSAARATARIARGLPSTTRITTTEAPRLNSRGAPPER
jgi:hypothetical protein